MGLIESIFERLFPPAPERLADVRHGRRVLVRGRVVPRDLIESPLSGARCVYYRYHVEEWRRSAVASLGAIGFWVLVEQDEAIAEFYLEDGSGRAVIAPDRAQIEASRALRPQAVDLPGGRRAAETRISAGDLVEVSGVVEEVDDLLDDSRGYRDSAARLIVHAPEGTPLRIRLVDD